MADKVFFKRGLYRPSANPGTDIALCARSVGHYNLEPGTHEGPRVKHFLQFFWGIKGSGKIIINGIARPLSPEHVAVYMPGMEHVIYSEDEPWEYRWWTMDGALAVTIATSFGFGSDVYFAGAAPKDIFSELEEAISMPSRLGEINAGIAAFKLLSFASACSRTKEIISPQVEVGLSIIHDEWRDPLLSVESIARRIKLHRSSFCRQFDALVGVSPVKYIVNLRLQNAMSLLRQKQLNISEIANMCGFQSTSYFARVMRKLYGQNPSEFRKEL